MSIEKMYFRPETASIRQSIFWGEVEEITSPEEASSYESCLPGVSVTGLEIDLLGDGRTIKSPIKEYLLPYSVYQENADILKIGTTIRMIRTWSNGGSTAEATPVLEFTSLGIN